MAGSNSPSRWGLASAHIFLLTLSLLCEGEALCDGVVTAQAVEHGDRSWISSTCRPAAACAVRAAAVRRISLAVTLGLRKNRVAPTTSARQSPGRRIVAVRRAQKRSRTCAPFLQAHVVEVAKPQDRRHRPPPESTSAGIESQTIQRVKAKIQPWTRRRGISPMATKRCVRTLARWERCFSRLSGPRSPTSRP